jgi:hypothetical protein
MATKQATHLQPTDCTSVRVQVCEWGGYMVISGSEYEGRFISGAAAFATADECADWLRGFLRNQAAKKFGAQKQS